MTKYQELISTLKNIDFEKAEYMEEEIDVMIHKLKFLTAESLPKTIILRQEADYAILFDTILEEKIKIAGGTLVDDFTKNPDCIIFIQNNSNLYSEITDKLNMTEIASSNAVTNDNIYIIQSADFHKNEDNYLQETEALAEIQQPKYFVFGRDGQDWVKFGLQ